jgi:hypothetical protein
MKDQLSVVTWHDRLKIPKEDPATNVRTGIVQMSMTRAKSVRPAGSQLRYYTGSARILPLAIVCTKSTVEAGRTLSFAVWSSPSVHY